MALPTFVYVVCSPEPRVGKTLTARLQLDLLTALNVKSYAFDTNAREPLLAKTFPRRSQIIDLSSTRGEVALFDNIVSDDGVPKVVDLWHVDHDAFFSKAQQLGYFPEAKRAGVVPVILLVADPRDRFVAAHKELTVIADDIVLVRNQGLGKVVPSKSDDLYLPRLDDMTLRVLVYPNVLVYRLISADPVPGSRGMQTYLSMQLGTFFERLARLHLRLALDHCKHR